MIGVGNLLSDQAIRGALQTGWAEFVAVDKAVLMNPNLATLLKNIIPHRFYGKFNTENPPSYRPLRTMKSGNQLIFS